MVLIRKCFYAHFLERLAPYTSAQPLQADSPVSQTWADGKLMPFKPLTGNTYSAVTVGMMLVLRNFMALIWGQGSPMKKLECCLTSAIITVLASASREEHWTSIDYVNNRVPGAWRQLMDELRLVRSLTILPCPSFR